MEMKWVQSRIGRAKLIAMSKDELLDKILECDGNGVVVFSRMTKQELVDILIPEVPRPPGFLSFQKLSDEEEEESVGGTLDSGNMGTNITPPIVSIADFLKSNGRPKTNDELKEMCRVRNLKIGGNKEELKNRLLQYQVSDYIPPKPEKLSLLSIYQKIPQNGSIMWILYKCLVKASNELSEAAWKDLKDLSPHILQHLDNSFTYHIIMHRNKGLFDFHFRNGIQHWQNDHSNCY